MARKARSNDDLVIAGAGAEGHGVMAGFGGDGPLTRDVLLDLARQSTIDEAWFPAAKDAKVQLSRAMQSVASKHGTSAEIFKNQVRSIEAAKEAAAEREAAEAAIPEHLLYEKGWPRCMPTPAEAALLSDVRKTVAHACGLSVRYTTPAEISARYSELMLENAAKAARRA